VFNRLTNISNAYGNEHVLTFDALDRPVHVTDATGVMITNTYDKLNRVLTRGYPDGGVENFGYAAVGLIAYTNQIGMSNYHAYNAAGRKTYETNANGEILKYTNGAAGDLLSLTDGKNQTTKWNYDQYGRVTNKVDQTATAILTYTYDADNRLLSRWSAAKGTTYYTNDAVGNLTYIKYPTSTRVSLLYDWLNRLTNMMDAAGTTKYTYTLGNQILTEAQPWSNSTLTNTYLNRLRASLTLQQSTGLWTNKFVYDLAARMTNVTSPAGAFGYTVGALNTGSRLVKKLLLPNTSYITNTFDSVARLTGTYLDNSSSSVLDSAIYGYNLAGQRTAFTNAAGTYVQYTYDNIGQLKVATSSTSSENRGYAYDAAWNMSWLTNTSAHAYTVDNKNELTGWPYGSATYDSNGNRLINSSYGITNTYDDENRLTITTEGTSYYNTFTYDGLGRLRTRQDYTWTGSSWYPNTTTEYVYDGTRVIQERDSSYNPSVSYTRGSDLSGTMEGAGGIGGLLARSSGYSSGNWTTNHFYHADGNGSIMYLVDSSQNTAATYRYDPYGNTLSSSGTLASANLYRFSSMQIHANSGMYIYLYRFYDPSSERWLNRDPLTSSPGIYLRNRRGVVYDLCPWEFYERQNLYGFVYNAPISFVDAYGLWSWTGVGIVVGGGVGGVVSTGISIVLDVGTFGINIAGTPGEIAAGAALGAAAGGLLGSVFDRSSLPVHGGPPNGSLSEGRERKWQNPML
jgi:RHS repeat-associated protein